MDLYVDILRLIGITALFLVLFGLPWFFIVNRIFRDLHMLTRLFFSVLSGLAISMFLTVFLASIEIFNSISFITSYILLSAIANLYFISGGLVAGIRSQVLEIRVSMGSWLRALLRNHVFYIMLVAVILGAVLRFYYALTNIPLPSIDPYGHLLVSKILAGGELKTSIGYYDDGSRGFHAVAVLLGYYSGIDLYTVLRFLGPILGTLSIGAVYCMGYTMSDRYAGAFAALFYSGPVVVHEINVLVLRQTQSIPEVLALLILPLAVIATYRSFHNTDGKLQMRFIIILIMSMLALWAVHPLTTLMAFYMLLPVVLIGSVLNKKILPLIISGTGGILILIMGHPAVAGSLQFYALDWSNEIPGLFSVKEPVLPVPAVFFMILVSLAFIYFGILKRDLSFITIGSWCIIFGMAETTGILFPERLPLERAMTYYALSFALLAGCGLSVLIKNIKAFDLKGMVTPGRILKNLDDVKPKALSVIIIMILILTAVPRDAPELEHFGYEESIEATLDITSDYPEEDTAIYSENIFMINRERTLIEPDGSHYELHELLKTSPANFTPAAKFVFIFIEKRPFPYRGFADLGLNRSGKLMSDSTEWVEEYRSANNNVRIYMESERLIIYQLTNSD